MNFKSIIQYKCYSDNFLNTILFDRFVAENDIVKFNILDLKGYAAGVFSNTKLRKCHSNTRTHTHIEYFETRVPYDDHSRIFKDIYNNVYYTFQPYYRKEEIECDVNEWCKRYGLKATYYDKQYSWYNRHNTSLVVITLPSVNVKYDISTL